MNRDDAAIRRDERLVFVFALLYGLAAFAVHLRWFPIGDLGVESDFYAEIAVSARRLFAGDFSVTDYPFKGPVTAFLLTALHAPSSLFDADWYRSAVVLNAICAACGLWLTHRLLRSLFDRWVALASTLGLALCHEYALHAHKASSDLVFFVLATAAMAVLLTPSRRPGRGRLFGVGALAGLAALTRYNGAALPLAAAAVVAVIDPWRAGKVRGFGAGFRDAGLLLAGSLTVAAPWFAANLLETGRWLPGDNLMNVAREFYGGPDAPPPPPEGFRSLFHLLSHAPGHVLRSYLGNLPEHLRLDVTGLLPVVLRPTAVAGLVVVASAPLWRRFTRGLADGLRPNRRQAAFFVMAGSHVLAMGLVFHLPRFSLPLLPAYFALGYGLIAGLRQDRSVGRSRMIVLGLLALIATVQQARELVSAERYYHERLPRHALVQAEALRTVAAGFDNAVLMARKPHAAHYAGLEYAPYPSALGSVSEFVLHAHRVEADLILVGEDELGGYGDVSILHQLGRAAGVTAMPFTGGALWRLDRTLAAAEAAEIPDLDATRGRFEDVRGTDDPAKIAIAARSAAVVAMVTGEWEVAVAILDDVLREFGDRLVGTESPDRDRLRVDLAYALLHCDRADEGLALLEPQLEVVSSLEDPGVEGEHRYVAGRLLTALGRVDEARDQLERARTIFLDLGREDVAARVEEWIP